MFFLLLDRLAEEEQEADRKEREALLSAIEEHKRLEAENQERIKNRNVSFQRDLDMQMDYQRRVKAKEMEEEEREFRMGQVSLIQRQVGKRNELLGVSALCGKVCRVYWKDLMSLRDLY